MLDRHKIQIDASMEYMRKGVESLAKALEEFHQEISDYDLDHED